MYSSICIALAKNDFIESCYAKNGLVIVCTYVCTRMYTYLWWSVAMEDTPVGELEGGELEGGSEGGRVGEKRS